MYINIECSKNLNHIDLKTALIANTLRPYQTEPNVGFSPPYYIDRHNLYFTVKAFYLFPVVVRIIPTSPLVDMVLYRQLGVQRKLQVNYFIWEEYKDTSLVYFHFHFYIRFTHHSTVMTIIGPMTCLKDLK